jgi:DNA-binding winged helix-turn-helix (wHTH) protein
MLNNHTNSEHKLLIVGDYLFEPRVGFLSGPSGAHYICSRMATLLGCLVKHSNETVERDHLIGEIWPDDPHASKSLNQCVARLRHYFGDKARAAQYIETVPNVGYRLIAPVYGSTNKPVLVDPVMNTEPNTSFGAYVYRLIQEFRVRRVCRSMLIYTMVVWLVLQVYDVLEPVLNLPDWVGGFLVMLGLLGFPIAATLSWIFNLTPAGLVRDPRNASNPGSAASRRWTDLAIDSALVSVALVICGMLVFTSLG